MCLPFDVCVDVVTMSMLDGDDIARLVRACHSKQNHRNSILSRHQLVSSTKKQQQQQHHHTFIVYVIHCKRGGTDAMDVCMSCCLYFQNVDPIYIGLGLCCHVHYKFAHQTRDNSNTKWVCCIWGRFIAVAIFFYPFFSVCFMQKKELRATKTRQATQNPSKSE